MCTFCGSVIAGQMICLTGFFHESMRLNRSLRIRDGIEECILNAMAVQFLSASSIRKFLQVCNMSDFFYVRLWHNHLCYTFYFSYLTNRSDIRRSRYLGVEEEHDLSRKIITVWCLVYPFAHRTKLSTSDPVKTAFRVSYRNSITLV